MVNGYYTKYEYHSAIHVWDIMKIHKLWQNWYKYPILAQSQSIFYLYNKASMMTDHSTHHEQNPDSSWIYHYKNYEIMNTTFWHRAIVYFTCIMSLLWLIAVANTNKINPFFSDISFKHIKFKKNIVLLTQIWHRAKCYIFYMCQQHIVSGYCTKYE